MPAQSFISIPTKKADGSIQYIRFDMISGTIYVKDAQGVYQEHGYIGVR